jgi:hypothetical protein
VPTTIVFAFLNHQVANLNCRQTAAHLNPLASAVNADEETKLSSGKQKILIHMVFGDRPDRPISRKVCFN